MHLLCNALHSLSYSCSTSTPYCPLLNSLKPLDTNNWKHGLENEGTPTKYQHGESYINENIFAPWGLQANEDYVATFIKDVDCPSLPKTDVCLNYHVCGSCRSNCPHATLHIAHTKLDANCKLTVSNYVAKVCEQAVAHG
jgi:hypothetical protein